MKSDKEVYVVIGRSKTSDHHFPAAVFPIEKDAFNFAADENEKQNNIFRYYVAVAPFYEAY